MASTVPGPHGHATGAATPAAHRPPSSGPDSAGRALTITGMDRRSTKIIATLGPSTPPEVISDMVGAGMDAARINFSHTAGANCGELVDAVRAASHRHQRPVAVLGDLCGPKMRLRGVPTGGHRVQVGDRFILSPVGGPQPPQDCGLPVFQVSIPTLCSDCRPGERILIADGRITGVIDTVTAQGVTVMSSTDGLIEDRKGVNAPDSTLSAAALTAKDHADVIAGLAAGIDMFALSFVRSADDVAELRSLVGPRIPVIAKIERPEALATFSQVCVEADGIMVARGDLGVEMGWERIPGLQIDLLEQAGARGKLSIVATEMLESMTHSERPTRAEVSDVASAVMDGASAVMLSAETAMGDDPVRVVASMSAILADIESHVRYRARNEGQVLAEKTESRSAAMAAASTRLARDLAADVIVSITNTGTTARLISAARPAVPVVAACEDPSTANTLALWWAIRPMHTSGAPTDTEIADAAFTSTGVDAGTAIVVSGATGATSSDRLRVLDLPSRPAAPPVG
jgi:pyruvate kinase